MKVVTVVLGCILATTHCTILDLSSLGDPCDLTDDECCTEKVSGIIPLILKLLGDPLITPKLVIEPGNSLLQLRQDLTNFKVEGLNTLEVEDQRLDFGGGSINLKLSARQIKFITDYVINGRLLLVPIWGKGKGIITLSEVDISLVLKIGLDNGKIKLTGIQLSLNPGDVGLTLSSLFGEAKNKILTPLYEKALSNDGQLLLYEVLPQFTCEVEALMIELLGPILSSLDLKLLFRIFA